MNNYNVEELKTFRFRCKVCNKYVDYTTGQNDEPCTHCTGQSSPLQQKQYVMVDVVKTKIQKDGSKLRWIEQVRQEV